MPTEDEATIASCDALWRRLRELWDQQVPAERLQPLLLHYIRLVEATDGHRARSLIVPLRWLALLHNIQHQYADERRVLVRTVSLMQRHLGRDHPQTIKALIQLLGCREGDEVEMRRQHLPMVMHFLVQRRSQLDTMDLRLLQAFVMALHEPFAGPTVPNRNAFLMLNRYVERHLAFDVLPTAELCHAVEILWYLAEEVGRQHQLVPTFRLLANRLAIAPADSVSDPGQVERLRAFVAESTRSLTPAERRKIRQALRVV